jgi:putative membrane protein
MKFQWTLIFALIFAILVAIFAIVNIDAVPINFVFVTAEVPLVLVILGSTLLGGLIVGLIGIIRQYRLQRTIRSLEKQLEEQGQHIEITEPIVSETEPADAGQTIDIRQEEDPKDK